TRLERGLLVRVAAPELKAGGAPQVALRARLVLLTMKRLEGRQCALIRLMLERIARLSEGDPGAWYSLRAALLNDVRQLVAEQRVRGGRPGRDLTGPEGAVRADGERAGAELADEPRRGRVGVDAHRTEIVAKGVLHLASRAPVERPSRSKAIA